MLLSVQFFFLGAAIGCIFWWLRNRQVAMAIGLMVASIGLIITSLIRLGVLQ